MIGKSLAAARVKLGLTPEQMAAKLRVKPPTYHRYEHEAALPGTQVLGRLLRLAPELGPLIAERRRQLRPEAARFATPSNGARTREMTERVGRRHRDQAKRRAMRLRRRDLIASRVAARAGRGTE